MKWPTARVQRRFGTADPRRVPPTATVRVRGVVPDKKTTLIYMRTESDRYSPNEISQLAALKVFADAQGWDLAGAAVEQRAYYSVWDQIREEFEDGKIQAVIMWDEEHGYPGVWEDDLPVL